MFKAIGFTRKLTLLVGLHFFSSGASAFVMNPAPTCQSASGVSTAQTHLFPDNNQSAEFSFSYKIFKSGRANATTVIVLPGGPGNTLIDTGHSPSEAMPVGAIPSDEFDIVYIDPRGVGCNKLASGEFPIEAYQTKYLANDVLSIIRQLNLKNYIVYGESFGTVLATYVADLAPKAGLPPPRAVVLEGTFGKGFAGGFEEYLSSIEKKWERVKTVLPSTATDKFETDPLPLGFSEAVWGEYIYWELILGAVPYQVNGQAYNIPLVMKELKSAASGSPTPELQQSLLQNTYVLELPIENRTPLLFNAIACQELWGSWMSEKHLHNGKLVSAGVDICAGHNFKYSQYDSKIHRIHAPIVYFQGPFDPATTLDSAKYHFDNQIETDRTFLEISGASHEPLTINLQMLGCSRDVWKAIDSDPVHLPNVSTLFKGWPVMATSKVKGQ